MTDIVERLRICAAYDPDQAEAAAEITRLREENARLREALSRILSIPTQPDHLSRDFLIRVPDDVLFEVVGVLERSCKEAKRAASTAIREGGND